MGKYIRYFFYLAYHWNIKIAVYIIYHDIKGEKKYAIHTTGMDELKSLQKNGIDITHATCYMPASYPLLEKAFDYISTWGKRHFLDLGCGKGRALCVAAHHGFNRVTGVDFSKEFCEIAVRNLNAIKKSLPQICFTVFNNDAFYFDIPDDVDCIFLFNPFDEVIMSGVVENIQISLQKNPRKVAIVYANPLHKGLFINAGFKEVYYSIQIKYLEMSILENDLTSV